MRHGYRRDTRRTAAELFACPAAVPVSGLLDGPVAARIVRASGENDDGVMHFHRRAPRSSATTEAMCHPPHEVCVIWGDEGMEGHHAVVRA